MTELEETRDDPARKYRLSRNVAAFAAGATLFEIGMSTEINNLGPKFVLLGFAALTLVGAVGNTIEAIRASHQMAAQEANPGE